MARGPQPHGFSLVELMVAIAIFALLTVIAIPSLSDWMRNTRVRSSAEALRAGLALARGEAIRRNTGTRWQLVSSMGADCTLNDTGPFWVVNVGLAQSPASACNSTVGAAAAPQLIAASPVEGSSNSSNSNSSSNGDVTFSATRSTIGFDALGRQVATTNPSTSIRPVTISLGSASGACVAAGGSVRCLNVLVHATGEARICDPARTAANDPMVC